MYGDEVTLKEGDPIGSVGIMLHNRRRNRLNCIVESRQPGSIIVRVTQSFGNCPKYIQGKHSWLLNSYSFHGACSMKESSGVRIATRCCIYVPWSSS